MRHENLTKPHEKATGFVAASHKASVFFAHPLERRFAVRLLRRFPSIFDLRCILAFVHDCICLSTIVQEWSCSTEFQACEQYCFFVSFRAISVSRRLAETQRVKRRTGVGANVAASIDRRRKVFLKHTDGGIQTRTPARRFSRVSDSARRRVLVHRPKASTRPFSTKNFDEPRFCLSSPMNSVNFGINSLSQDDQDMI